MNKLILAALATTLCAQERNPFANEPQAAEASKSHFRINCALCHGLGAKGGGRGPDLTRAQKRHGSSGAELFRTIRDGIPGTDMPAAIESIGVKMKDREIWQVITYLRSVEVKAPPLTGDSAKRQGAVPWRHTVFQLPHRGRKRRAPRAGSDRRQWGQYSFR